MIIILIILCAAAIMHICAMPNKYWSRVKLALLLVGVDIGAGGALYLILSSEGEDIGQVAGVMAATSVFALPAAVCYIRFSRFAQRGIRNKRN